MRALSEALEATYYQSEAKRGGGARVFEGQQWVDKVEPTGTPLLVARRESSGLLLSFFIPCL
jgi:hypothetical protein